MHESGGEMGGRAGRVVRSGGGGGGVASGSAQVAADARTRQADGEELVTHATPELVQGGRRVVQLSAVAQALQQRAQRGGVHAVRAAARQLHVTRQLRGLG